MKTLYHTKSKQGDKTHDFKEESNLTFGSASGVCSFHLFLLVYFWLLTTLLCIILTHSSDLTTTLSGCDILLHQEIST